VDKNNIPITRRPLSSWYLEGGRGLQFGIVAASLSAAVVRVLPIEFQRLIVNEAIQKKQIDSLYLYCAGFFVSALAGLLLKYGIQFMQNILGERILMKMRNDFFNHALTLPWKFYLNNRPGEIVTPLVNYLGPVGDYLGAAWALPLTNLLTLLAMTGYLASINPLLALLSMLVYPLALVLLPKIQKLANQSNRDRLRLGQILSGKIAETFSGIEDIQAHSGYAMEDKLFSTMTYQLRNARIRWRLFKLGSKITNNFFISLSPFFFLLGGGIYAIKGQLNMGELLAFLSAQALMFSPWTELMNHIQVQQDASVQYRRVQAFFDYPAAQVATTVGTGQPLNGRFQIQSLFLDTDKGSRILDGISLTIEPGKLTVLVGRSGSGKSMLLRCLAGKIRNYGGHILADGQDLKHLTSHDLAISMGVVSQAPYMFDGTLQDNLLYPLHSLYPANDPPLDDMIFAIQQAGLYPDLLLFGLNRTLEESFLLPLSQELLQMRRVIRQEASLELASHLDSFHDWNQTLVFSGYTLLENILGGKLLAKDTTAVMAWLPRIIPLLMAHDLLETTVSAGLQYRIGSKGERLSGGQRQRLALAAILLKQPGILLLDEVGSGLDHNSRTRVAELYNRLKGTHTIIAVEHNLEQIYLFDQIAVMDQGRIRETGSFDELMARKGCFYEMITSFKNSNCKDSR